MIHPLKQWISLVYTESHKAVKTAADLFCQNNQLLLLGLACMWLTAVDVVFVFCDKQKVQGTYKQTMYLDDLCVSMCVFVTD